MRREHTVPWKRINSLCNFTRPVKRRSGLSLNKLALGISIKPSLNKYDGTAERLPITQLWWRWVVWKGCAVAPLSPVSREYLLCCVLDSLVYSIVMWEVDMILYCIFTLVCNTWDVIFNNFVLLFNHSKLYNEQMYLYQYIKYDI